MKTLRERGSISLSMQYLIRELPANQSLKLTAEAEVVSRCAQENEIVVAARRQCGGVVRDVVGKVGHAAA